MAVPSDLKLPVMNENETSEFCNKKYMYTLCMRIAD